MIDDKDFSILTVVNDADKPLWKKAIHTRLHEQGDDLPCQPFSIQTVGRHMDALYDQDLLSARIMSPNEAQRTLITTYRITDAGLEAIERYRDSRLRQETATFVEDALNDGPLPADRSTQVMFAHRFGLDEDAVEQHLDTAEVLCLTLAYFLTERIESLDELSPVISALPSDSQLRSTVEDYLL